MNRFNAKLPVVNSPLSTELSPTGTVLLPIAAKTVGRPFFSCKNFKLKKLNIILLKKAVDVCVKVSQVCLLFVSSSIVQYNDLHHTATHTPGQLRELATLFSKTQFFIYLCLCVNVNNL